MAKNSEKKSQKRIFETETQSIKRQRKKKKLEKGPFFCTSMYHSALYNLLHIIDKAQYCSETIFMFIKQLNYETFRIQCWFNIGIVESEVDTTSMIS